MFSPSILHWSENSWTENEVRRQVVDVGTDFNRPLQTAGFCPDAKQLTISMHPSTAMNPPVNLWRCRLIAKIRLERAKAFRKADFLAFKSRWYWNHRRLSVVTYIGRIWCRLVLMDFSCPWPILSCKVKKLPVSIEICGPGYTWNPLRPLVVYKPFVAQAVLV